MTILLNIVCKLVNWGPRQSTPVLEQCNGRKLWAWHGRRVTLKELLVSSWVPKWVGVSKKKSKSKRAFKKSGKM